MSTRSERGLVLSLGLLVGLIVILIAYPQKRTVNRKARTAVEIHQCYLLVGMLQNQEKIPIENIVGNSQSNGLNHSLVLLADRYRAQFNLTNLWSEGYIKSAEFVDAWGRPLQMFWGHDLTNSEYGFLLTNIDSSIVIWSLGKNGTNDCGRGDDVVWFPARIDGE